jgi:glycosyltransferase involved in cell wall biosynthesis
VVHDWLTGMRGGESALEHILTLVPEAQLFTLMHTPGSVSAQIESHRPRHTFVQHLPFSRTRYRNYLPIFPAAIEHLDLDDYDIVISTSHCAAKAAIPPGKARHLCYCFTPMRYAWDQFDAYFGVKQVGRWQSRFYRIAMDRLASWDMTTADRVDRYVAISQYVASRIDRYYNREADVIYPPVDTKFFCPDGSKSRGYFVVVSALVPYKRVDMAINACRLAGVELRIVGTGPETKRLQSLANSTVKFMPPQTKEQLRELYRGSEGFLLTGEEDFGIAPLEAQACGRPVIALGRGGALETVDDGITGLLVKIDDVESFANAIQIVAQQEFDPNRLHVAASRFSPEVFYKNMRTALEALAYNHT